MRDMRRKLAIMLILGGAALPLALVSLAYACGILATVHLNRSAVASGASVSGFGNNYSTKPKASAVVLHFNSRTGRALWTGRPDQNGNIALRFTAPRVRPGYYVVDATQTSATGAQVAGTPGRAVLRIGNPHRHGAAAAWPIGTPGSGTGSYATSSGSGIAGLAGSGVLVGSLSGVLLAGGALLLLGDRRRGQHSVPAF